MKSSDLKIYTGIYIDLQENLLFNDKMMLLDFVSAASETEVVNLLVTGKMEYENEIDIEYAYEAFSHSPVPYVLTEGPAGDILKTTKDYWGKKAKKVGVAAMDKVTGVNQPPKDPNSVLNTAKDYWSRKASKAGKAAMDKITGVSKQPGGHGKVFRTPPTKTQQLKDAAEKAKEAGEAGWKWLVKKAADVQANPQAMQGLKVGAAAATAALVIFIGRKVYKQHFSKVARMCKKADDKQSCIRKIKVEALNKQLQAIKSNMGLCDKAKKPEKCKAKIEQQMNKKKSEIQKVLTKKKMKV